MKAAAAAAWLIAACVVSSSPADAGAWLQEKGGGYLKVAFASFRSDEAFDATGRTVPLDAGGTASGDYTDVSFSTYLEYGLHDRITLIASVPIKQASKGDDRTVGIGDFVAGLRAPLYDGPLFVSISSCLKLPLYGESQSASPSLGTAGVDGDLRLLAGRSFWPMPAYATAEVGYRRRHGFADQVIYSAELGATLGRLETQVRLAGENSRVDPAAVVLDPANPNFGDQDFLNLGVGAAIRAGTVQLTFDAIRTVSGRNTAKGTYLSIGVAHAW